ncbi:MAG TPA: circadian clock protein KaiC, partial [Polyangia bacterium]|nr:circadian clock protein KaiC [Polyangia bacterium]
IEDQVATRRLRVIKYRGSSHGSNEYPFLIDEHGFSVLPVTSLGLDYAVSSERVSTGVPRLDDMLDGGGYFRGSSVLISGTAGTGKSSVAAQFVAQSCRRGERAIYFALEESSAQVVRNMRSIGVNLETWVKKGLLSIQAARPTVFGLEMHLVTMHKAVEQFAPRAVVLDPISSLMSSGNIHEVKSMMVRLFDYLKMKEITCLVTSLAHGNSTEETAIGISSLIDTWFQLRDIEIAGERTRGLYLVKSRGMGHSNQVREFLITNAGINLVPVAIGPSGVLTGSARLNQEALQRAEALQQEQEIERRERDLLRRKRALDAQIETLRLDYLAAEEDTTAAATQAREQTQRVLDQRAQQTESRSGKVTRSKR